MKHWWNHSVNNTAVTHALWLCCQNTGFFCFVFESARILRMVKKAWLDHISGCVATLYHRQSILPCFKSWGLFSTFVNIGPVGHFLPKQACFFTVENWPRIVFCLLDNFLLTRPATWQLLPHPPMQLLLWLQRFAIKPIPKPLQPISDYCKRLAFLFLSIFLLKVHVQA